MKRTLSLAAISLVLLPALVAGQGNRPDRPSGGPGGGGQRPPAAHPGPPQGPQPGARPPSGGPSNPGRPPVTRPPSGGAWQPGRPPAARPPAVRPPVARPPRPQHRPGAGRPPGFRPVHRPPFQYPRGYRYRRWSVGLLLPGLFLSSRYYYDDWYDLGMGPPPPGYRWVRYGPDLLLVQTGTRRIADVIYGAFY